MKVYQVVRAYLDKAGIKQTAVARKINMPISIFNAMMNGKRQMTADDLAAICNALGVSANLFIRPHGVMEG